MEQSGGTLSVDGLDAAVELMGLGGRRAVLRMQGDSMLPTLRSGQWIAVDLSPARLERGDLLLYRQRDYLVVHRFLGRASREDGAPCLRTRGDGRITLDPPLERRRVRGRVFAVGDGDCWRDLDGGGARAYALALAVHDLFWAGAGLVAARADRVLRRNGLRGPFLELVAAADRGLLGPAHRALFRALHPRVVLPGAASPPAAEAVGPAPGSG